LITKQHQQTKINKNKTQTFSICLSPFLPIKPI